MSKTQLKESKGWILYDGDCSFCWQMVQRFKWFWANIPLKAEQLQAAWVREQLGLDKPEDEVTLLRAMRVLTLTGEVYEGATAILYLLKQYWWTKPLYWLGSCPGIRQGLEKGYQWVAKRRHCRSNSVCSIKK
jgi:predicted DCC family thiol-disulfide oxidoreductase YuxK